MRLRNKFVLGLGTITLTAMPLVTSAIVEKNTDDIKELSSVQENSVIDNLYDLDNIENSGEQFYEYPSEVETNENDGSEIVNQQLSELSFLKDYYHLNEKPMPRNSNDNEWFIETFVLAAEDEIRNEWVIVRDIGIVELEIPTNHTNELIEYVVETINNQNELIYFEMMQSRSFQFVQFHSIKKGWFRFYHAWDLRISKKIFLSDITEWSLIGISSALTIAGFFVNPTLGIIMGVITIAISIQYKLLCDLAEVSPNGIAIRNHHILFFTPIILISPVRSYHVW